MKQMDENFLKYKYPFKGKLPTIPFKITLSGLFPSALRKTMIDSWPKPKDESKLKDYTESEDNETTHILLRILLPEEYRTLRNGKDMADFKGPRISPFFTYLKPSYKDEKTETKYLERKSSSHTWYIHIAERIIRTAGELNTHYGDFRLLKDIKFNLELMFKNYPDEDKKDYAADICELIGRFEKHPFLTGFRENLKKEDFYSQLACLVLLAVTWSCWDSYNTDWAKKLSPIILPPSDNKSGIDPLPAEENSGFTDHEIEEAESLLNKCRKEFEQGTYQSCIDTATQILKNKFTGDSVYGEAYYWLALCLLEHNNNEKPLTFCFLGYTNTEKSNHKKNANAEVLRKGKIYGKKFMSLAAQEHGNFDARNWLRTNDRKAVSFELLHPISKTQEFSKVHGIPKIVINTTNKYTEEFLLSIPSEMKEEKTLREMIIPASGKKQLESSIDASQYTYYLLFDEVSEKNFQDLLYVLNGIGNITRSFNDQASSVTADWSKITIYLRVPEDQYATLIDTALKRLGNFTVQVHIIDDEKWAAQSLLYNYPLCSGLKNTSPTILNHNKTVINYTIIGNGNRKLTTRLIREAYWMGCFAYTGIHLRINLIAPDADIIKQELRLDFPGMFAKIPDLDHVSSVSVLEIDCTVPSISDYAVMEKIDMIENFSHSFNYYVVNVGDDVQNLNYGIKLREWTIRNRITGRKSLQSRNFPMISFYCSNSDIAHLSKNMVVQTVDHGNRWFNNYNIKPFGMLCDRYSWACLDGGYLERVAESTHLQYCGVQPSAPNAEIRDALKDYFSRSYNRDSSMAVALSLPYRLFHIMLNDKMHLTMDSANTSDDFGVIAEQFHNAYNTDIENTLLYYEHSRWLRWAYSRGWKKASPEDVHFYMDAGNPKQQLFIARLHGCLCSLDELQKLSKIKDFTAVDRSNIKATKDLLQTKWFVDAEISEPEK